MLCHFSLGEGKKRANYEAFFQIGKEACKIHAQVRHEHPSTSPSTTTHMENIIMESQSCRDPGLQT